MIRFYNAQLALRDNMDAVIADEHILRGNDIWENAKEYFKRNLTIDVAKIQLLPVVNKSQEVICFAYQDSEANREIRMLKELEDSGNTLQFHDIFPEIRDVVVCGCNELAYYFVRYLEKQQISVAVTGKYWDFFGYEACGNIDLDGNHKMVVYAEGVIPQTGNLYQTVIRSMSPEFEYIDKIYEANVLAGKIRDAKGDLDELLRKVREKEIVILGADAKAQDIYDLLYEHGIDICCFTEWKDRGETDVCRTLLGKPVVNIEEALKSKSDTVFIECNNKGSALGTEIVDSLDYYGYERNEQFFLIRDYTDVPGTNLLHVLKGKKVFFAGDEQLCAMLFEYLRDKEQGDIELTYIELSQCEAVKETDILCVVNPWIDRTRVTMQENPKVWYFWNTLAQKTPVLYTDYFSQVRTLVEADLHRTRGKEKYALRELCPKGILLGRIQAHCGNVFFRGILDGHPNILKWGYRDHSVLNNNLFLYCIRLAGEKAEDVMPVFKKMYREEFAFQSKEEFSSWDKFEENANRMLSLKDSFTSQELFVIFHISFAEMLCGYKQVDLDTKVIYWEPHMFPRDDFPFLAQWLEDEQINGKTVLISRDMMVRAGSSYLYSRKWYRDSLAREPGIYVEEVLEDNIAHQYWEEFHMRFEDIKLHPQRELRKFCARLGIPWSDTMLRVTANGRSLGYEGIFDFDIKPVFNKNEEVLSEFDRFRIIISNSLYQKKYGYTYENCMKYSRKELQIMFLKPYRFQERLQFRDGKDKTAYFLRAYKIDMKQLWEVRKHMVMDDIVPEFGEVEIGQSITEKKQEAELIGLEELDKLLEFIRKEERLVLYGTGRDCEGLMGHLNPKEQEKLVFSDLKAEYIEMSFHNRKVVAPRELNKGYKDYKILITSSQFYENMQQRLEDMGISKERIFCNRFQLWEEIQEIRVIITEGR